MAAQADGIHLSTTKKKKRLLTHEGFSYTKDKDGLQDTTYWRCERRGECKGRCKTVKDDVFKTVPHCHPPDATRVTVEKAKEELRTRAATTIEPTSAVLRAATNDLSADCLSSLPKASSLKKSIQRERLAAGNVPLNPRNLQEL